MAAEGEHGSAADEGLEVAVEGGEVGGELGGDGAFAAGPLDDGREQARHGAGSGMERGGDFRAGLDFGFDAAAADVEVLGVDFEAGGVHAVAEGGDHLAAAAHEGDEAGAAGNAGDGEHAVEDAERFLRGVGAVGQLVAGFVVGDVPDGAELLAWGFQVVAEVGGFDVVVVEAVLAFGAAGVDPQDGLVAGGEAAGGEVGEGVALVPDDLVDDLEPEGLAGDVGESDVVVGAVNPDGAGGLDQALEFGEPGEGVAEAVDAAEEVPGVAGELPLATHSGEIMVGVELPLGGGGGSVGRVGDGEVEGGVGEMAHTFDAVAEGEGGWSDPASQRVRVEWVGHWVQANSPRK